MSIAFDVAAVLGLKIENALPAGYAITSLVTAAAIFKVVEQDGNVEWQDPRDPYFKSAGADSALLYLQITMFDAEEHCDFEVECAVDVDNRFLYIV